MLPSRVTSPAARALMQEDNEHTAVYFAASILTLMIIFTLTRILGLILQTQINKHGPFAKTALCSARILRSLLLRKVPGFTSLGHALIFLAYLAINFAFTFQNLDASVPWNFAKRIGWIAACNIAIITFLALKNTPLAFLTAYSYERLNILHQLAGYTTIFCTMLHAITYIVACAQSNYLDALLEQTQIMGLVAGLSMLIIFATATRLRKMNYEAFYIVHILMFMLILVTAAMHRPELVTKSIWIIVFAASIWVLDRLVRGGKMLYYAAGNTATITPLPHGGMRIALSRKLKALPGSHVFLWVPKVRAIESHPFTIVSTNPVELVISARDGFTKDLLAYASAHPNTTLRASCDGPYGKFPNFNKFDNVVLIAGGSGASFTFGTALNLIRNMNTSMMRPRITFIWVFRDHYMTEWFTRELSELSSSPHVSVKLHLTRSSNSNTITSVSETEKVNEVEASQSQLARSDPEKSGYVASISVGSISTFAEIQGRPDIFSTLDELVVTTKVHERTIVAACGPDGMMRDIRGAVVGLVKRGDRSIELHCETFGW